jgi:hypothetical protein
MIHYKELLFKIGQLHQGDLERVLNAIRNRICITSSSVSPVSTFNENLYYSSDITRIVSSVHRLDTQSFFVFL